MKTETKKKVGIAALITGVVATIVAAVKAKAAPLCTPGEPDCRGYDLYRCSPERKWVLEEANSPSCGWEPGDPEFQVTELAIEPTQIYPGETVTISVLVTNVGETAGTKTVVREVAGVVATQDVTLDPGDSDMVSFELVAGDPGVYPVTINGLAGSFTVLELELAMLYGYLQGAPGYPDDLTIIRIQGTVDVAGVQVSTDNQGNFELYGIEPGEHQITFSSPGYQDAVRTAEFLPGEEKHWTPILHPTAPQQTIGMQIANPPPGATHWKFTVAFQGGARSSDYTPVTEIAYPRAGSYPVPVPAELRCIYVCTLDYSIWEEWWGAYPIDSYGMYEFDWDTKTLTRIE